MPPQLDVVALVFSLMSETAGAYAAGALAAILGVALIGATMFLFVRRTR